MADLESKWIINFHGIGRIERPYDPGEESVWISKDRFLGILDAIAGDPTFEITFDDGNLSDLAIAVPELIERDLTATFFIPAGKIGHPGFLGYEEIEALIAAGMPIGSHGWSHRSWRHLDPVARKAEFEESKRCLEEITGSSVDMAACPFGDYDRSALRSLKRAGYRRVYSSDRGWSFGSRFLEPRNTVHGDSDASSVVLEKNESRKSMAKTMKQAVKRWR
ncbi:MAG: polysaccharide deacetylase family protein [Actinomycetales bacterium]|nr:polysaccharide deacetylase family protein [Actinomycetales bacterium]